MALEFPEGTGIDPATGLLLIGETRYPLPSTQANLDTMVDGVVTQTPWEISEPDFVSGKTRLLTSTDGTTFTNQLTGDSYYADLPDGSVTPNIDSTAPIADPAVAQQEAVEEVEGFTEADFDAAEAQEEALNQQNVQARAENKRQAIEFDKNDWRVRLHLAPKAEYLYKALDPGILAPLAATKGIIFPYTPEIQVQYNANYENYDLTHSNYRGYFYTGSQVENIIVTATFTANDLKEANYMLASMHFLRSATKMFYGQDQNRGMPPPLVFLSGLGEYQFNNHPCAITMMNYNLPTDVDFIPCGIATGVNDGAPLPRPKPAESGIPAERVKSLGLDPRTKKQAATTDGKVDSAGPDITYKRSTYVPTKLEINFTMIPIQTREQVSKDFSLEDYASGKLLRRGFW